MVDISTDINIIDLQLGTLTNNTRIGINSDIAASLDPIILTPSQRSIVETCGKLLPYYKILVIKGDSGAGKNTTVQTLVSELELVVEEFDLCYLAKATAHELSNQDLVAYINTLISKLRIKLNRAPNSPRGIIYLRHYNRIVDILMDCYIGLRFLLPLILRILAESLPSDMNVLISTQGCLLPEGVHWCTDLTTTRGDMEHILNPFVIHGTISEMEKEYILRISKIVPVGRILYCLRYAIAMTLNLPKRMLSAEAIALIELDITKQALVQEMEKNVFIEFYRKALSRFSGSTVDIERDVPKPIPEDDLVGVDEIIDEINISIINPMRLAIPGISIKKGLLLCGPPGTGKTSIGRWLAHQIKGKFYLIGGGAGSNGNSLIEIFETTVIRARENAPAVIFIDDGDSLFLQNETYRAFLTILDGIETNKRSDVCVILTCMNMRNVPSSLLRGGRLEMALVTRLPDRKKIQIILQRSLTKMQTQISQYNTEIARMCASYITTNFINEIACKMAGWNCADIHRCVNDVARLLISNKGTYLTELFDRCIKQIRDQYILCGKCESTNLDERPYETYIQ